MVTKEERLMTYMQWVRFVLDSFSWSLTEGGTYIGYLKLDWEDGQPSVEVDIREEHLTVWINYKIVPTYQEWKSMEEKIRVFGEVPSEAFFREVLKRSPHKVSHWDYKQFHVDGNQLNLIPWVKEIVYRSM